MKEKLIELIIAAKKTDPETGSFTEWLADQLIANGVTFATDNNVGGNDVPDTYVGKWIPVAEEKPKVAGEYIVKIAHAHAATALWYNPDEDVWFSDDYRDAYPVTRWMPLPELPKGE